MIKFDINDMTIDELRQLQRDLIKAFSLHEERIKAEAHAKIEAIAREYGISITALMRSYSKQSSILASTKFQHPENPSLTWSGRGRKPQWFHQALASGKTPEDLTIHAG